MIARPQDGSRQALLAEGRSLLGRLQEAMGYQSFFVLVMAASAIPLFFAWKAPFPVADTDDEIAA